MDRIIGIYSSIEENNDDLYSKIILENSEKQNFDREKYTKDFEELIMKPTLEELYHNLKAKVRDGEQLWGLAASVWQTVLGKYNTYTDIETTIKSLYKNNRDKQIIQNIIKSIETLNENGAKNKVKSRIKEALKDYSEKELEQITSLVIIQKLLLRQVSKKVKM